jgi:arginine decarboxylase
MSWTPSDSATLYNVPNWGRGMFDVSEHGTLEVRVGGGDDTPIDLKALTVELQARDVQMPVLLRFPQVAERRLQLLRKAFETARTDSSYPGAYRPVYPIKVNQQANLVDDLVSGPAGVGLEAGSKPELCAAMALLPEPGRLLICNGYKDAEYIRLALDAQTLGLQTIIVIEKLSEVQTIVRVARERGVRPTLGMRARLSRPGAGRWRKSSGDKAKFGLSAAGLLAAVGELREAGFLDCLKLLHFHIGSQVSNIRTFKRALREGTRLYVELAAMGAPMGLFDVGGGLGVDYDGSRTDFESSMNYTITEYAADVVSAIHDATSEAGLSAPDLVTESGRSTVAHCSVLLFDVVGVESVNHASPPPRDDDPDLVVEIREVLDALGEKNVQSSWHDARDVRERARQAFELGVESLPTLGHVEQLYWAVAQKALRIASRLPYLPEELEDLETTLADTYYGNFSLFQSLPDSWAIGQLFPVLPIQRLGEEPTARAVVADLTCDSDGRIDRFVDQRDVRRTLPLHTVKPDEDYVLAVCLVGAYQEILGDLHNLFGDTHAVHVVSDGKGHRIERVLDGETVTDVLRYVQYERKDLVHRIRSAAERAMERGVDRSRATAVVAAYRAALDGYTYLS